PCRMEGADGAVTDRREVGAVWLRNALSRSQSAGERWPSTGAEGCAGVAGIRRGMGGRAPNRKLLWRIPPRRARRRGRAGEIELGGWVWIGVGVLEDRRPAAHGRRLRGGHPGLAGWRVPTAMRVERERGAGRCRSHGG